MEPHLDQLREHGLEVDTFLADCERMHALLDGHDDPTFDIETFQAQDHGSGGRGVEL